MFDYLKYYLPVLIYLVCAAGLVLGGDFTWMGVATLPALAVLDTLLPLSLQPRKMRSKFFANIPVWLCTLLGPTMYALLAWNVSEYGQQQSAWHMLGAILSCGWTSVLPFVPASHELYHQRGALARFVGRYSQVCYPDCTREIAHVVGHHIDVATPLDGDTAARGQTLYSFTPSAVLRSFQDAVHTESAALVKRGYGRWSIRHRLWKAILAQVVFQALMFAIGGWQAVATVLCGMVVARFWVESFNYFQHYGLIRIPGAPIQKRHVWNHLAPLSRIMTFEITNHADHHLNSFAPYYALTPDASAIRMPSVFVCFFAALLPPVWFSWIIMPALKRWDEEFAVPEERAVAAEQNRLAGWPDWNSTLAAKVQPC